MLPLVVMVPWRGQICRLVLIALLQHARPVTSGSSWPPWPRRPRHLTSAGHQPWPSVPRRQGHHHVIHRVVVVVIIVLWPCWPLTSVLEPGVAGLTVDQELVQLLRFRLAIKDVPSQLGAGRAEGEEVETWECCGDVGVGGGCRWMGNTHNGGGCLVWCIVSYKNFPDKSEENNNE